MNTKTKIEFDSSVFQNNAMRAPKGRGSWVFSNSRLPHMNAPSIYIQGGGSRVEGHGEVSFFTPSMTYNDAKKWAKDQIRAYLAKESIDLPELTLYVLP